MRIATGTKLLLHLALHLLLSLHLLDLLLLELELSLIGSLLLSQLILILSLAVDDRTWLSSIRIDVAFCAVVVADSIIWSSSVIWIHICTITAVVPIYVNLSNSGEGNS